MAMSRRRKIVLALVAIPIVLVLAVTLSFGSLVRREVSAVAERVGADVEIGWVSPRWDGLHLENVTVGHPDAPSFKITFADVRVAWSEPRSVEIDGGTIAIEGSPESVLAEIERLRSRTESKSEGGTREGRTISAKNLVVRYKGPHGSVEARGVGISRVGSVVHVDASGADLDILGQRAAVSGLVLEVKRGAEPKIARFETTGLVLRATRPALGPTPPPSESAPVVVPVAKSRFQAPILRARSAMESASRVLRDHLEEDAVVKLGGLSIEVATAMTRSASAPEASRSPDKRTCSPSSTARTRRTPRLPTGSSFARPSRKWTSLSS